jgi:hypothetical protein
VSILMVWDKSVCFLGVVLHKETPLASFSSIGPSNKYIFKIGVGDILILLTV